MYVCMYVCNILLITTTGDSRCYIVTYECMYVLYVCMNIYECSFLTDAEVDLQSGILIERFFPLLHGKTCVGGEYKEFKSQRCNRKMGFIMVKA